MNDPKDDLIEWLQQKVSEWSESEASCEFYKELHRGIRLVGMELRYKMRDLKLYKEPIHEKS